MKINQFNPASSTLRSVAALMACAVVMMLFTAIVAIGAPDRMILAAVAGQHSLNTSTVHVASVAVEAAK